MGKGHVPQVKHIKTKGRKVEIIIMQKQTEVYSYREMCIKERTGW